MDKLKRNEIPSYSSSSTNSSSVTMLRRHSTSVAGRALTEVRFKPGTCTCTGAFETGADEVGNDFAPMLANWTTSFLSLSCIPFRP